MLSTLALALAMVSLGQLFLVDGRCHEVMQIDVGTSGAPYAWLVYAGDPPRGVLHVPVDTLTDLCMRGQGA